MLKQNTISFVFNATATATILVVVDLDPNWSPPSSPTREEFWNDAYENARYAG